MNSINLSQRGIQPNTVETAKIQAILKPFAMLWWKYLDKYSQLCYHNLAPWLLQ